LASTGIRARTGAGANGNGGPPRTFMPPTPNVAEPFRLTPQLALRLAILGAVALGVFGILFFRLWALQVLSGPKYLDAAQNNQLRSIPLDAPRGPILDSRGRTIVDNRGAMSVQLWTADLPQKWSPRLRELKRLSKVINVPVGEMITGMKKRGGDASTPVTVQESIHRPQILYLEEHERDFPGVRLASSYLRHYPYQSLAAQVLGSVGLITPDQYKRLKAKGLLLTDKIGQGGVESRYDAYLRGRDGLAQFRVDAFGRPRTAAVTQTQPTPGEALRLTINMNLQRAAEQGIRTGIAAAHASLCKGCWASNGGAIVAMDPRNGSILALASNPTFQPSVFTSRDPKKLKPLLNQEAARRANFPSLDRAVAGGYPPGSTFKPVTALAALEERLVTPYEDIPCTGVYHVYGKDNRPIPGGTFHNWDPFANQAMTLPTALEASCDTYFYELGYRFYKLPAARRHPFQEWASRFGFGKATGVDVPGEVPGLLPTPEWLQRKYTAKTDPGNWQVDRLWKPGDSIQLAIGQKDLLVTPLQLTRFYAMVANGGKLVTPHVVEDIEQAGDDKTAPKVIQSVSVPPPVDTGVDQGALDVVRQGLYGATHAVNGTATSVFGAYPIPVAGKTGTAEKVVSLPGYHGLMDQSWWCGYAPVNNPTITVCALIENGGHGGTAAAPAALKVFEQFFHLPGVYIPPSNTD